jgi:hypothetical protein
VRFPKEAMKVRVYRNLNRRGPNGEPVYSLVSPATGRVIVYASRLTLEDVQLVVRHGGWKRARATRRRNVHAFVVGVLVGWGAEPGRAKLDPACTTRLRYNPLTAETPDFRTPRGRVVKTAKRAVLDENGLRVYE